MKIAIFSDVHWTRKTSIMDRISQKYSENLEHLIDSMNWVNQTAKKNNCAMMICAGDFFSKSTASDEEITAVKEISWNDLPCYFLCGNHESSVADLRYSSLKILDDHDKNHFVISNPLSFVVDETTQIHFLPYVKELNRQNLETYLTDIRPDKKQVIISHNDIAGIQYGGFESKSGFSIDEIEQHCDIFLNGHIHNSEWISKKILNVGSFSGHNFTNNSSEYQYGMWILDTDSTTITFIENPFSYNFYKFDIYSEKDIDKIKSIKNNAVLWIKCLESYTKLVKNLLVELSEKIVNYRVVSIREVNSIESVEKIDLSTDPVQKFIELSKLKFPNDKILFEELAEICK